MPSLFLCAQLAPPCHDHRRPLASGVAVSAVGAKEHLEGGTAARHVWGVCVCVCVCVCVQGRGVHMWVGLHYTSSCVRMR